jgi:hypothetical protein
MTIVNQQPAAVSVCGSRQCNSGVDGWTCNDVKPGIQSARPAPEIEANFAKRTIKDLVDCCQFSVFSFQPKTAPIAASEFQTEN